MRTPGGLFVLASNPFTAKSRSFLQHNMLHDALASDFGTAVTKPIRIGTAPMALTARPAASVRARSPR